MPSTEAGKRLLGAHIDCQGYCEVWAAKLAIEEIEAEARENGISDVIDRAESDIRRAERARLAEAVRGLPQGYGNLLIPMGQTASVTSTEYVSRVAVLALLEPEA